MEDLKTRRLLQSPERFFIERHLPINNLVTLNAYQVGMRLRTVAIIMAVVMQIDLQHLVHFFQQSEGFVNCCMTDGWKLALDS